MKILFFDIETLPNISYTWGKWDQNVVAFVKEWELASFAWKWQGSSAVHVASLRTHNEKGLTKKLHSLFDEADIIIAHNGDRFDIKKSNSKFLEYGLKPPSSYQTVDTLKIARRHFAFNSNKLDDLGKILGVGRKVRTGGWDLWQDCIDGKKSAWLKMEKYNKQDVVLLERVYEKLKAWHVSHPVLTPDKQCKLCGSKRAPKNRGLRYTRYRTYQRYQCRDCGSNWSASKIR